MVLILKFEKSKGMESIKFLRLSPPDWRIRYIRRERNDVIIFQKGAISVSFCVLDHKIDSIAYRMQENTRINMTEIPFKPGPWIENLKDAFRRNNPDEMIKINAETSLPASELFYCLQSTDGFSLGYAMDHLGGGENHEKLESFFRNLDELYIESFFRHIDWDFAKRHHHCTSYLSGLLARKAGVKKLNLVHHSRRYLSKLEILSKKVEPPMRIANQNLTVNLILGLNLNQVVSQKSRHNISISLSLLLQLKICK